MNRNLEVAATSPFFELANRFFDMDIYPEIFESKKNSGLSNVSENENDFSIEISVPGLKKDDIKIELENDILKISSDIADKKEEEKNGYYRKEYYISNFERCFTLPKNANKIDISASMIDGILNITIPKLKEQKTDNIKIDIK